MSDIPLPQAPEITPEAMFERLSNWYLKQQQLAKLKAHEHLERVALSEYYFPSAPVGTHRLDLGTGHDLKVVRKLNYKVLEDELDQVKPSELKKLKVVLDDLITYKPQLKMGAYNALTDEQRALVDRFLDITDASPTLEIVPKADTEGQQRHIAAAEAAAGNADATGSQAEASPASEGGDDLVIVAVAEEAQPGQYFHDGETWWQLDDEFEWAEVEDADLIELLVAKQDADSPAEPVAPKRRGRKAAAK